MSHYTDMKTNVKAEYRLDVNPAVLAKMRSSGAGLALNTHRALARDILSAGSPEMAASISTEHVYHQKYWVRTTRGMPWDAMLGYRARNILSMRGDGITEPVELFFDDKGCVYYHGYHRLATALELGLQSMPVKAYVLGDALHDLSQRLFSIYKGEFTHTLYQPVAHPFFRLFPVQLANSMWEQKVAAVQKAVRSWEGEIVEVGAHFGMLTRALRNAGIDIRATDCSQFYVDIQSLFEGIGLEPVPYEQQSIQALAQQERPVWLVIMGLMHHLVGKPDLWTTMEATVLPWMERCVQGMVVEMSLLDHYLKKDAAVTVTSDADVDVFWRRYGFTSQRLVEGSMRRVTYLVLPVKKERK